MGLANQRRTQGQRRAIRAEGNCRRTRQSSRSASAWRFGSAVRCCPSWGAIRSRGGDGTSSWAAFSRRVAAANNMEGGAARFAAGAGRARRELALRVSHLESLVGSESEGRRPLRVPLFFFFPFL